MYFRGFLFHGDDKYRWNGLDCSEITVERDSRRSRITSLPNRFNATCSCNLSGLLLQLCLLPVCLVRLVALKCDFELLLFELRVWFVGRNGKSLPM